MHIIRFMADHWVFPVDSLSVISHFHIKWDSDRLWTYVACVYKPVFIWQSFQSTLWGGGDKTGKGLASSTQLHVRSVCMFLVVHSYLWTILMDLWHKLNPFIRSVLWLSCSNSYGVCLVHCRGRRHEMFSPQDCFCVCVCVWGGGLHKYLLCQEISGMLY